MGLVIGEHPQMTKREAKALQKRKQRAVDEADEGTRARPLEELKRMTVKELLAADVEAVSHLADGSVVQLEAAGAHLVRHLGEDFDARRVSLADVERFIGYLRRLPVRGGGVMSEKNVLKVRAYLSGAWERSLKREWVGKNVWRGKLESPQTVEDGEEEPEAFSEAEVEALLEAASRIDEWWHDLILVMARSGLGPGELLNVRVDDVADGCLHVSGKRQAEGILPWVAKRKARYRKVPLPADALAVLERRSVKSDSGYVFIDAARVRQLEARMTSGRKLPGYLDPRLRDFPVVLELAKEMHPELRGWVASSLYGLRRHYASFMATSLKSPKDLMTLMGHSSLATAMKYYSSSRGIEKRVEAAWKMASS